MTGTKPEIITLDDTKEKAEPREVIRMIINSLAHYSDFLGDEYGPTVFLEPCFVTFFAKDYSKIESSTEQGFLAFISDFRRMVELFLFKPSKNRIFERFVSKVSAVRLYLGDWQWHGLGKLGEIGFIWQVITPPSRENPERVGEFCVSIKTGLRGVELAHEFKQVFEFVERDTEMRLRAAGRV